MKLTKSAIERLPTPTAGQVFYRDEELRGFGLRVTAGGVKTFIFERRIQGKPKRITIGRFGDLAVQQARAEAQRLAGEVALRKDPVAERRRTKVEAVTLGQACGEYLKGRALKPRTVSDFTEAMQALEDWKPRALTKISGEDVRRRHAELGVRSHARANLTMRYLRSVFSFAMATYTAPTGEPIIATNPVTVLSRARTWHRVDRRQTFIDRHQLRPWLNAVLADPNTGGRDLLLFAVLTGLRREEVLGLKWANVDLEGGSITLADTKAHRTHRLPLSDFLWEMLKRRQADSTSEWVFEGKKEKKPAYPRSTMERVEKASGVPFCMHDLRRTFATIAESLDTPAYALKRLLNHSTGGDVTAGYIVPSPERLREPMQKITDYVLGHVSAERAA